MKARYQPLTAAGRSTQTRGSPITTTAAPTKSAMPQLSSPASSAPAIGSAACSDALLRRDSWLTQQKGRRNPAAFRFVRMASLLRRLLPRRFERAGVMDLGDLVVGE